MPQFGCSCSAVLVAPVAIEAVLRVRYLAFDLHALGGGDALLFHELVRQAELGLRDDVVDLAESIDLNIEDVGDALGLAGLVVFFVDLRVASC